MSRRYYFLLSSLPPVPEPGGPSPMDLASFRQLAAGEDPGAARLVEAVLLEHDLLLRQAWLAGEKPDVQPVVLSDEQARGEAPLPDYLQPSGDGRPVRVPADATWDAYWHYVARIGRREGSEFLQQWVAYEVTLRNAIAGARALVLGLEAADFLVATDLGDPDAPVRETVLAWSAAPDPLKALRVLEEARWQWADRNARYFSFAVDELAAYARKLVLVTRWERIKTQ